MKVSRAVVVPCDQARDRKVEVRGAADRQRTHGGPPPPARIVPKVVVEAHQRAREIVQEAESEAQDIRERATAEASDVSLQRQARARADALSLVVRQVVELHKRQAELDASVVDRSIGLAQLLAERLLGEQLSLEPERVAALARQTLLEVAGARRAVVTAHPDDAQYLRAGLEGLETPIETLSIESDASLARGQIRVETELGVVEANLPGQLERLSTQLRQLLLEHA